MQPHAGHLFDFQPFAFLRHLADDAHIDAGLDAILQKLDHLAIADLHLVDQQLFFRVLDEIGEARPGVLRAHQKRVVAGRVRLARRVGLEEPDRFGHNRLVLRGDAHAAALFDIEPGEVETKRIERLAIDQHHLVVIAHEVVVGARHRDAGIQQLELQLAESLGPAARGVRNEGVNFHPRVTAPSSAR